MTQVSTKAAEAYENKIQQAVSTVKKLTNHIYQLPSSRPNVLPHLVTVNSKGEATSCSCEFGSDEKWEKYGHKCYHCQAVERKIQEEQAVKAAETIVAEAAKTPVEIKTESTIESYVRQGVSRSTAERIATAKGVKAHGNAKAYEPRGFSLLK